MLISHFMKNYITPSLELNIYNNGTKTYIQGTAHLKETKV